MALMGFGDYDESMFGRVDRMMNHMMQNMFGSMHGMAPDPYEMMSGMAMPVMPAMPRPAAFPGHSVQSMSHSYAGMPHQYHHASNSISYSSSVMSMTSDGSGRPQIYEATQSSRSGPGGVRETQSTVRDSASGYQEMSIGRHIQERGHVMQRTRNTYTGDQEENDEYINIEEEEAPQFQQEWQQRAAASRYSQPNHREYQRQLLPPQQSSHQQQHHQHPSSSSSSYHTSGQLALPAPPPRSSSVPQTRTCPTTAPPPPPPSSSPSAGGSPYRESGKGKISKRSKKDKRPYRNEKKLFKL